MSILKILKNIFSTNLTATNYCSTLHGSYDLTARAIWTLNSHNCECCSQKCVGAKHTVHFGMFLIWMVCGSKFCSGWNSASIFRSQPSFYVCKHAACPFLVSEQKRIDVKPIFTVPDIMPNLALISETVKISAASIFLWLNTSWHYWLLLVNIILYRPCNLEGKLSTKLFF